MLTNRGDATAHLDPISLQQWHRIGIWNKWYLNEKFYSDVTVNICQNFFQLRFVHRRIRVFSASLPLTVVLLCINLTLVQLLSLDTEGIFLYVVGNRARTSSKVITIARDYVWWRLDFIIWIVPNCGELGHQHCRYCRRHRSTDLYGLTSYLWGQLI